MRFFIKDHKLFSISSKFPIAIFVFILYWGLCSNFVWSETFFEGGPGLYELLYTNPYKDSPKKANLDIVQAKKNIIDWMNFHKKREVNLFSLSLLDLEGLTICDSSVLRRAGFRYIQNIGDIFPFILIEAKKRKFSLSISIDDISHIINGSKLYKEWIDPSKLKAEDVALFIEELGHYSKKYHVKILVNEESFGPHYIEFTSKACRKNNITYIRYSGDWDGKADIFCSEDYATYPIHPESNPDDAFYLYNLSKWGATSGRIGYLNLMFGRAYVLGKSTGVLTSGGWGLAPGCQQNVALFRSIQSSPSLYYFYAASYPEKRSENEEDVKFVNQYQYKKNLLSLIQKYSHYRSDFKKPIGNLILDPPDPPFDGRGKKIFENALISSTEAITNAIESSGLKLAVSIKKPLPNAKLYYIFTAGSSPKFNLYRDISANLLPLFLQHKKKVFFQTALGIPRGRNWRKVAPVLGLPSQNIPLTNLLKNAYESPIPASCQVPFPDKVVYLGKNAEIKYKNYNVKYRGYQFIINKLEEAGKLATYHHLNNISYKQLDTEVEVLAAGDAFEKTLPLITRKGNFYFVNGNFIHLGLSSALCNLMCERKLPVFHRPSYIYFCKGRYKSAIFAAAKTTIDLFFKHPGKIYHWKSNCEMYKKSSLKWQGQRLQGDLKKWELIIILSH